MYKNDTSRDSISWVIARYATSKIYHQALGALSAYLRPKLLSPDLFGLWNILSLIPAYASYAHLGSRDAIRYLIPYNEAQSNTEANMALKGSAFYGSLALNLILIVPLLLLSLNSGFSPKVRWGLLSMCGVIMLNWYAEYYLAILKSYQLFRVVSGANYIRSSTVLVLSILLIPLYGLYGVYLTALLSETTLIVYFRVKYRIERLSAFDFTIFRRLVSSGFPIMVFSLLLLFMMTSGRIVVSYLLGNEQLGYYGISVIVLNALMNMPGSAREVLEPRLMEDLATNEASENFERYFLRPLISTAYYIPFVIGPVVLAFPVVIPLILPKYIPGILSTQILTFGMYFLALAYLFRGIIVAHHWQIGTSFICALMLVVNIGLNIGLVKLGYGIEGAAFGSSISFFLLFAGLLSFVVKRYPAHQQTWRAHLKALVWPFPAMCITLFAVSLIEMPAFNVYIIFLFRFVMFISVTFAITQVARRRYHYLKSARLVDL